jgi:hypothetical protein
MTMTSRLLDDSGIFRCFEMSKQSGTVDRFISPSFILYNTTTGSYTKLQSNTHLVQLSSASLEY